MIMWFHESRRASLISQLAPRARLLAAAMFLLSGLLSDAARPSGALLLGFQLLVGWILCSISWSYVMKWAIAGVAVGASTLLLLMAAACLGEGSLQFRLVGAMTFKAFCMASLAWAILSRFRLSELLEATAGLPETFSIHLAQILTQTFALLEETRRMGQAWALRGSRSSYRMLLAAPWVWLPRVAHRAERLTAAMDLRGIPSPALFHAQEVWRNTEWAILALCTLLLTAAILVRHGSIGQSL